MSNLLEQINKEEKVNLGTICHYVSSKVNTSKLSLDNYITTDSIISERGGIEKASKLPDITFSVSFINTPHLIFIMIIWPSFMDPKPLFGVLFYPLLINIIYFAHNSIYFLRIILIIIYF